MVFGFGPAKTSGIATTGKTFTAITNKLRRQVRKGGLSENAALRWTADKGLYAKDGIWNTSNNTRYGSGRVLRGDKYMGAREEIARSINLGYGFRQHKDLPIGVSLGDYVVKQALKTRAGDEIVKEWDGMELSDEEFEHRVEKKIAGMELLYQDIDTIQEWLNAMTGINVEAPHRELTSTVQYMRGNKTQGVMVAETDNLREALRADYLHYYRKKHGADEFDQNRARYERNANRAAEKILSKVGLKDYTLKPEDDAYADRVVIDTTNYDKPYIDGGISEKNADKIRLEPEEDSYPDRVVIDTTNYEKSYIDGGISEKNAEKIRNMLHRDGILPRRTAATLRDAKLPGIINAGSKRFSSIRKEFDGLAGKLFENQENILRNRLGDRNTEIFKTYCADHMREIQKIALENQLFIEQLKKKSYPNELTDNDQRRIVYDRLILNIARMDQAVSELYDLHRDENGKELITPSDAFWKTYEVAEKFCLETLDLAKAFYSPIQSNTYETVAPPPLYLKLPQMPMRRGNNNFILDIRKRLEHEVAAPEILFQADPTGESRYNNIINDYNGRIDRVKSSLDSYLALLKEGSDRSKLERRELFKYRRLVKTALKDNERLTSDIKRRQKILGEVHNEAIDKQLGELVTQRKALLLLYYPELMRAPEHGGAPAPLNQAPSEPSESLTDNYIIGVNRSAGAVKEDGLSNKNNMIIEEEEVDIAANNQVFNQNKERHSGSAPESKMFGPVDLIVDEVSDETSDSQASLDKLLDQAVTDHGFVINRRKDSIYDSINKHNGVTKGGSDDPLLNTFNPSRIGKGATGDGAENSIYDPVDEQNGVTGDGSKNSLYALVDGKDVVTGDGFSDNNPTVIIPQWGDALSETSDNVTPLPTTPPSAAHLRQFSEDSADSSGIAGVRRFSATPVNNADLLDENASVTNEDSSLGIGNIYPDPKSKRESIRSLSKLSNMVSELGDDLDSDDTRLKLGIIRYLIETSAPMEERSYNWLTLIFPKPHDNEPDYDMLKEEDNLRIELGIKQPDKKNSNDSNKDISLDEKLDKACSNYWNVVGGINDLLRIDDVQSHQTRRDKRAVLAWENFKDLQSVKSDLEKFRDSQKKRVEAHIEPYLEEVTSEKQRSLNMGPGKSKPEKMKRRVDRAQELTDNVDALLEEINKMMLESYGIAYVLSSSELREEFRGGAACLSQQEKESISTKTIRQYNIDNATAELEKIRIGEYAVPFKRETKKVTEEYQLAQEHLNRELEQLEADYNGFNPLETVIQEADTALTRNMWLINVLSDPLNNTREDLISKLEQDRASLLRILLEANVMLHNDAA